MTIKLGVVMDPIAKIHYQKDSTLAMLFEAQARNSQIFYFELQDIFLLNGEPSGFATELQVFQNEKQWFQFGARKKIALKELDVILMRKDPPVDTRYIYSTYILEHAEQLGVLVVNAPRSLRNANEKLFATFFPSCSPKTIVTQSTTILHDFLQSCSEIVVKPLDGMGGTSVFRLNVNDANRNVIFDVLTNYGNQFVMAQQFIPNIKEGDKRILMVHGKAIPYALARVPQGNDWRGNLAAGAKGIVQPLTDRDRFICETVGPVLRENKLYFVGLDIIGDYLTEINVTSPTCIREIDVGAKINIASQLFDVIEKELKK